jgi:hypothetical protein
MNASAAQPRAWHIGPLLAPIGPSFRQEIDRFFMIKRQRGRGRNPGQKPQNNNPNRAYESNGPDLKVRGSAQTVFEKYQQLGRDAQSNGDRVLGENYMQHAEHYFRMLRAMQPSFVPRTELMIAGYDDEYEDGEDGGPANGESTEGEGGDNQNGPQPEFQQNRGPRDNNRDRDNRDRDNRDRDNNRDRPQRDFQQNREPREPRDPNEPRGEGDEGRFGRRRRRPDRFGNEGGYQGNGQNNGQNNASGDNSQNEGRREPRPDYRGENNNNGTGTPIEAPASFAVAEFAPASGFSNPQEIIKAPEADGAPVRERRPRPPRTPRPPRDSAPEAETGFGNELPAFLATSVPVTSGD